MIESKPKTTEATLVPMLEKKYGAKKAKKITDFLVGMHNQYMEYPGSQYSVSRRLWHREDDRELRRAETMELYVRMVAKYMAPKPTS